MCMTARVHIKKYNKQAAVRGTTNPAPCCHLASANEMSNSTGSNFDNKQIDLWPADPRLYTALFTTNGIENKMKKREAKQYVYPNWP